MDEEKIAYQIMEDLRTFGYSIQCNDPSADADEGEVAKIIADSLVEIYST